MPRHVHKGDLVMVTTGREKGRQGTILRVMPDGYRVIVEGINVRRKNVKRSQDNPQGGQIDKAMPIHISNISPVVNGKATRVRFETKDDGVKVRIAAATNEPIGQELKKKKKA